MHMCTHTRTHTHTHWIHISSFSQFLHHKTDIHTHTKWTRSHELSFCVHTCMDTSTHTKGTASPLLPLESISTATSGWCAEVQHPAPDAFCVEWLTLTHSLLSFLHVNLPFFSYFLSICPHCCLSVSFSLNSIFLPPLKHYFLSAFFLFALSTTLWDFGNLSSLSPLLLSSLHLIFILISATQCTGIHLRREVMGKHGTTDE